MLGKFATALQFLLIGWMIGLLTAPRPGPETRRLLVREMETLGKPERLEKEFGQ